MSKPQSGKDTCICLNLLVFMKKCSFWSTYRAPRIGSLQVMQLTAASAPCSCEQHCSSTPPSKWRPPLPLSPSPPPCKSSVWPPWLQTPHHIPPSPPLSAPCRVCKKSFCRGMSAPRQQLFWSQVPTYSSPRSRRHRPHHPEGPLAALCLLCPSQTKTWSLLCWSSTPHYFQLYTQLRSFTKRHQFCWVILGSPHRVQTRNLRQVCQRWSAHFQK
mmetsp:Transcript_15110/g.38320  ORF Transcript_15110/g.38320 Transcript_15110/m.38320 type:complete len:215 (-) Transcript_15110:256-900(-)